LTAFAASGKGDFGAVLAKKSKKMWVKWLDGTKFVVPLQSASLTEARYQQKGLTGFDSV